MAQNKDFVTVPPSPVLPLPGEDYERRYHDKHNSVLRLFFNELLNAVKTVFGVHGGTYINTPFGDFTDDADQIAGSTTSAYAMQFNTTEISNAVNIQSHTATFTGTINNGAALAGTVLTVSSITTGSIVLGMKITGTGVAANTYVIAFGTGTGGAGTYTVSVSQLVASTALAGNLPSKITVDYNGLYEIVVSAQFSNNDSAIQDIDVWFARNGTNVTNSNNVFSIVSRHGSVDGRLIAIATMLIDLEAGDYVEVFWRVSDTKVFIEQINAATSPTRPATPSVILSIKHVSNVL